MAVDKIASVGGLSIHEIKPHSDVQYKSQRYLCDLYCTQAASVGGEKRA
jgi:hypothetical protein